MKANNNKKKAGDAGFFLLLVARFRTINERQ